VALYGMKVKANASKHKAMSYGRMTETEQRLAQEITARLQAEEARRGMQICLSLLCTSMPR
jgi:hypothetical protein